MKHKQKTRLLTAALVAVSIGVSSAPALADDLFDGTTMRAFSAGSSLALGTTIGGYPIFQGDNHWHIASVKKIGPNNVGVTYGRVHVVQYDGSDYLAEMLTAVNVNQSGQFFYMSSNNCGGEHLVKVDGASAGRGDSAWDNCLTIDPYVATIGKSQITTLHFHITNSQEGARYYETNLLISVAALGLAGTTAADWSTEAVAASPERKKLIDNATAWGKQLQDATRAAIAWRKPQDAFKNVASWRSLAVKPTEPTKSDKPDIKKASTATASSG